MALTCSIIVAEAGQHARGQRHATLDATKDEVHEGFETFANNLPASAADVYTSTNTQVAVRLFVLLVSRGVQHRAAPSATTLAFCRDACQIVCEIEVTDKCDDMFVSYLVFGLITHLDLLGDDLEEHELRVIRDKITLCRDWISAARHRMTFGHRETEGTYAWNHSVAAGAALALGAAWSVPDPTAYSETDLHDIDFGLTRIEAFFIHGIRDGGVPYEGFFYCGVVMRLLGIFDILIQRDAEISERYQRIRTRHTTRLGQLLDWYGSSIIPRHKQLISFNHSPYNPDAAIAGLLSFFRHEHSLKASQIWRDVIWDAKRDVPRQTRNLRASTLYEAVLFLHPDALDAPPYQAQTLISEKEGYALVCSDDGRDKLFVKSSKLLYGPHNQADAGHFTWISGGQAVLIDAGPGTKARDKSRTWPEYSKGSYRTEGSAASSYGHNAVLIDGKGQRPSGDGHGVEGQITYARVQAGYQCIGCDTKSAYNQQEYNLVDCADRHIAALTSGGVLLVVDHIRPRDDGLHQFERLLHFAAAKTASEIDGIEHMCIKCDGQPFELMTLAARAGDGAVEVNPEDAPPPIGSRLVVGHRVVMRELSMYTVVFAEESNFSGAVFSVVDEQESTSGDALRVHLKSGSVHQFHVSQANRLVCRIRTAQQPT